MIVYRYEIQPTDGGVLIIQPNGIEKDDRILISYAQMQLFIDHLQSYLDTSMPKADK